VTAEGVTEEEAEVTVEEAEKHYLKAP
jgi:hypothetical protein